MSHPQFAPHLFKLLILLVSKGRDRFDRVHSLGKGDMSVRQILSYLSCLAILFIGCGDSAGSISDSNSSVQGANNTGEPSLASGASVTNPKDEGQNPIVTATATNNQTDSAGQNGPSSDAGVSPALGAGGSANGGDLGGAVDPMDPIDASASDTGMDAGVLDASTGVHTRAIWLSI